MIQKTDCNLSVKPDIQRVDVGSYPHIVDEDLPDDVIVCSSIEDAEGYDIAVLVTAHKSCVDIDWQGLLLKNAYSNLYDGRRVLD